MLAADAGLSWVATVVMSATTFAGSAQFAAASVLETGGGAIAAIVVAVLLNARYVPLSVSVASIFPGSRRRRLAESQLIVDESWALAGRTGRFDYGVLVGAGLLFYVLWVAGTAAGTLVGDLLDPETIGLDAAFPALFLALLVPYVRARALARRGRPRRGDHLRPDPGRTTRRAARRRCARVPRRAATVSDAWIVVAVVGAATVLFKAAGPVFLGRRELPPRVRGLSSRCWRRRCSRRWWSPSSSGATGSSCFDAPRLLGVAAAGVALVLRAPLIVVPCMVVAGPCGLPPGAQARLPDLELVWKEHKLSGAL